MVLPGDIPYVEPRWAGVVELNIGDEWRGRWSDETELPGGIPVIYAYATVFMADKGYVTRPKGSEVPWGTVEGSINEGETPEAFVKRAAKAQIGAAVSRMDLVGYLECRATSHNKLYEAGAPSVWPVYTAVAKSVSDVPDDSGFERRRLPLNEFAKAIRTRYPEIDQCLSKAVDHYVIIRAKGEV